MTTEITLKAKCRTPGEWVVTASDGQEFYLSLHVLSDGYRNWIISGASEDENLEVDDIRSKAACIEIIRDHVNGRGEKFTTVTLY